MTALTIGRIKLQLVPIAIGVLLVAVTGTLFQPAFTLRDQSTVTQPLPARRSASNAITQGDIAPADAQPARTTIEPSEVVLSRDAVARMVQRGQGMIAVGDFASARLLLARAADAGNPDAVFALAATYDPNVLSARGARGLVGEPEQAKVLYARALAAGIQDAAPRMAALGG